MNWKSAIITFLIAFLLVGLLTRGGACPMGGRGGQIGPSPEAEILTIEPAGRPWEKAEGLAAASFRLRAEVADTDQKRKQGLVGRDALQPGYGMLYVYEEPRQPKFDWSGMKFGVSAAFMKADGTIIAIHTAPREDQQTFAPPEPIKYALETRPGWFADRVIEVGDRMSIPERPAPATAGPGGATDEEAGAREKDAPAESAD
ncbi:MAG: DUF192 domain-containing protein [Planctomycetota bacterium]